MEKKQFFTPEVLLILVIAGLLAFALIKDCNIKFSANTPKYSIQLEVEQPVKNEKNNGSQPLSSKKIQ